MKNIIFVFALMLRISGAAHAQVITNAQPVWSVVKYQTTCSSTTVGITAADLTSNTTSPANTGGISYIKVTNAHPSATICCGSSSGVTCGTGAATDGEAIAPVSSGQKNFLSWAISLTQKWYCISTVALTGATVCKVR